MSYGEMQEKEIATIRPKTIKLNLSEADCERVSKLCGKHGITLSSLLESFIGDLVNGTYTNGSDERDYAESYFNRCWFGSFPEETLLRYLLSYGFDVDDFITAYEENEYSKENPQEFEEERADLEENEKLWFESDLDEMTADYFEQHPDKDLKSEYEIAKKWFDEMENLKNE